MKNLVFWFLALLALALGALIIPGTDFLAWHLLHPAGFWQRFILLALEVLTLWPRFLLALLVWAGLSGLAVKISD